MSRLNIVSILIQIMAAALIAALTCKAVSSPRTNESARAYQSLIWRQEMWRMRQWTAGGDDARIYPALSRILRTEPPNQRFRPRNLLVAPACRSLRSTVRRLRSSRFGPIRRPDHLQLPILPGGGRIVRSDDTRRFRRWDVLRSRLWGVRILPWGDVGLFQRF